VSLFQEAVSNGISTKTDEEFIDLSEYSSLKFQFSRNNVIQFWLLFQQLIVSAETIKILLPFSSSYICEVGFSVMVGIKNKHRNKLNLLNSLQLKINKIDVNVNAITKHNRKQAHIPHTPHY
jgi:hypothetical protein